MVKLAADGTELWRKGGFRRPESVSVNAADGSCWVADADRRKVVKLAADGTKLKLRRVGVFDCPLSVSVNPTDGSVSVGDWGTNEVVKLAADGTELWRKGDFRVAKISVNPTDGSVCVLDQQMLFGPPGQVVKLAADGTELWRKRGFEDPTCICVNPTDGSVWVGNVVKFAEEGWHELAGRVTTVRFDRQVVKLAADGTVLCRKRDFHYPHYISVKPTDGSVWVVSWDEAVKLSSVGQVRARWVASVP